MRKAKDDRVKITTHHFRISIEEEEDEENKEVENTPGRGDAEGRISITIEADSGVVIGGQDLESWESLPFDEQEYVFGKGRAPICEHEDGTLEKAATSSEKSLQGNRNEHRQKVQSYEFDSSWDSDGFEGFVEAQTKETVGETSGARCTCASEKRKRMRKMQTNNVESEQRSSISSNDVFIENRGSFAYENESSRSSTASAEWKETFRKSPISVESPNYPIETMDKVYNPGTSGSTMNIQSTQETKLQTSSRRHSLARPV
ncbi:uncharacterized protein LOC143424441 [Xylocopa sonorina]|uniref:uncharacterized protein LOC143424441 n=1 Tax=Xylocopa sonorina TaxID=1818115 RepID=UPI00403ABCF2